MSSTKSGRGSILKQCHSAQALFPAGHWLRALIARAEGVRRLMPHELLQFYRHEGFEI